MFPIDFPAPLETIEIGTQIDPLAKKEVVFHTEEAFHSPEQDSIISRLEA
jgi:hypothetical protein